MLALLWFASCAFAIEPDKAAQLLKQADSVRTSDHAQFAAILEQLGTASQELSPAQREYLDYLRGWQLAYDGDYEAAIPVLQRSIDESADATLRFRARATMVNVLSIAKRYEDAFSQLGQLLQLLPTIADPDARAQALGVIAYLYNQVGDYDLGSSYAQTLAAENWAGQGSCKGGELRLEAHYRSGKARSSDPDFQAGIDACTKINDPIRANLIRTYIARLHLDQGRFDEAINLLEKHRDEVAGTGYAHVISEYDALLAKAYRHTGRNALARQFALSAVASAVKNQYTEPLVVAYRLLYSLAQEQGDLRSALVYHEKYAAADKGYIDDVSARQLAYERVKHDAVANRLQIDALNKQNQVLQLQRALGDKAVENSRLYIALLIMVLGFILLWAYKTKRSQLHFMKLSRHDGLTGIANRPHFIEQAQSALDASKKAQQEVSVVLCDLDHFKTINDKYGHAAGDFVLKQAVVACQAHLRADDIFGRVGGEEFGVVFPGCSLEQAGRRAEHLRRAIAGIAVEREDMRGDIGISASFGIATTSASGYELRQLLADADAALYRAKNAGRNRVMPYDARRGVEPAEVAANGSR